MTKTHGSFQAAGDRDDLIVIIGIEFAQQRQNSVAIIRDQGTFF